jgi:hypothetical protein
VLKGSLLPARTGLMISISDPKYQTSHANGTEMDVLQSLVIQYDSL